MKRRNFFILFLFVATTVFSQQYFDTVQLRKSVEFMSADDKMGRLPGTDGSNAVAEYILAEFNNAGLNPLCNGGYQYFSYIKGWKNSDSCAALLDGKKLVPYSDFAPVNFFHTRSASLSADVVFIGNAHDVDWEKCKGKWVMMKDDEKASYKSLSHKAINQGVGGLILIDTSNSPRYEYSNVLGISVKKSTTLGPVIKISATMADSLLAKKNLSLSQVLTEANKKYCIPLGVEFKASTSFEPNEITAKNVVAVLEGSDPELRNEYIVVGGHYDHVGFTEKISNKTGKMRTYIYNGADDNASGVSAVLQIAKAMKAAGERPKRTVIFAFWDGEEKGLLGSKFFVGNWENHARIKAYMNFDMVGRGPVDNPRYLKYFFTEAHPAFGEWLREDCKERGFLFEPDYVAWDRPVGGSDNGSFARVDVPIVWYHTEGHPDYHRPSDSAEKIDYPKLLDITRAAYLCAWRMANEKEY